MTGQKTNPEAGPYRQPAHDHGCRLTYLSAATIVALSSKGAQAFPPDLLAAAHRRLWPT